MSSPRLPVDSSDPSSCLRYVAALPLNEPADTQRQLGELLAAMNSSPPAPGGYLNVLEMARPVVAFVQRHLADQYACKPLPPLPQEEDAFSAAIALWRAMLRSYARVAQLGSGQPEIQGRLALVCQRCLHYSGRILLDYLRTNRQPETGLWLDLHGYYGTAEDWQLVHVPVAEPQSDGPKTQSCKEAFAAVLLADLADIYGHGPNEIATILRWSQRFASFVDLLPLAAEEEGACFAVDLARDASARPLRLLTRRESVRRIATPRLNAEFHRLRAQLKAGISPGVLGLGADCSPLQAGRLLVGLYRKWCLGSHTRRFPRRSMQGSASLCYGFDGIYFHISGSEFQQPEHVRVYSRAEMESIWTFRDQIDPTQPLAMRTAQSVYAAEEWKLEDSSLAGFRLHRAASGTRIEHHRLVGIRPPDGGRYLLAQISWHQLTTDRSRLIAGLHILPGIPKAVSLRRTGPDISRSERYVPAFLLPAVPALNEQPSLVAPRGWYEPERMVEVFTDKPLRLQLTGLLGEGSDFERIAYQPAA